ncbi:hypothetical protein [Pseudomonas sp. NPDC087626]|uniref:hypothetical protein n=1 Tax=Pseudomonas sp. NPDC087626 TaxID=3364444 RepID=UPI00382FD5FF
MLEDVCNDLDYDQVVEKHQINILGENIIYIKRSKPSKTLLITMATLKNNGVYGGLLSYYRHFPGDIVCVTDPTNSYYLREDGGSHMKAVLAKAMEGYAPENVVFFGASMAGYAAIDLALHFNANAVTNNPQLNFDVSRPHAWNELRGFFDAIPNKHNIDNLPYQSRASVICAFIGQHPMDIANRDTLLSMCGKIQGIGLILANLYDTEHKYYYEGLKGLNIMVDAVLTQRAMTGRIHTKFPNPA